MAQNSHHQSHDEHHEGGHHIVPFELLTKVLLILIALTVLTVVTAKFMHLGVLAAPVAVIIAVAKAALVMAVFMGMKYETAGNKLVFLSGFAFLGLLFIICAIDIWTRYVQVSTL